MTPAARLAAAIDVLDRVGADLSDQVLSPPVEQVLINWARGNRYAGSGDRAAIRDIVYDILRKRRSCAAAGQGDSGRALVLGHLHLTGQDAASLFTGEGYAPAKLDAQEALQSPVPDTWPDAVQLDIPDWLEASLRQSLGQGFRENLQIMRDRAPVFLRVNHRKARPEQAMQSLTAEGIATRPHPLASSALEVLTNPRRIAQSAAFLKGWVELQDAASQAVVEALPLPKTGRILDYCAGGGGKSLAIAALSDASLSAFDQNQARMQDIAKRSQRAGVKINCLTTAALAGSGLYDLVLADVPCSGSGAWRRMPAAKWTLTPDRLAELLVLQQKILIKSAEFVRPGGVLAYATCSVLAAENGDQILEFLSQKQCFTLVKQQQFTPLDGGDGLFVAVLLRD
jgi:16S rRNA (cytosine967-C5)-methyltransferase